MSIPVDYEVNELFPRGIMRVVSKGSYYYYIYVSFKLYFFLSI